MKDSPEKKEILIIKNISREDAGLLKDILRENGIIFKVVDLSQGQEIESIDGYGAVVVLGGPDSANDESPRMKSELALIRKTLDAKIPYLGICLGLQGMVKAAGGLVVKCPVREIGFLDQNREYYLVELTEEGRKDSLFKGIRNTFNVFHLHGETVILSENMKLLAAGKVCSNQIIKIGSNAYGIQCHIELTTEMFETWINEDPDLLKIDKEQLRSDFQAIRDTYLLTGRQLFQNFLRTAGFRIQMDTLLKSLIR
jgi:GMP synthase (glutamine-hydrolysing)